MRAPPARAQLRPRAPKGAELEPGAGGGRQGTPKSASSAAQDGGRRCDILATTPLKKILKFSDYPKRLRGGALSEGIPKPGRSKKFKIFFKGVVKQDDRWPRFRRLPPPGVKSADRCISTSLRSSETTPARRVPPSCVALDTNFGVPFFARAPRPRPAPAPRP